MSSDLFKNPYKKKGPALKFKSKSGQKKNITNNEIFYNKPDFKLGDEPGIVKEKPKSKPSGNKNNLTIITICVVISTISICFYVAYNIYKDYRNNKEVQKYVEEANNIIENFNSETKKYTSSLKPNANTTKEIHEFKQATHISVNPYNFVPVNMKVGPKHNPFNSPLTYTKPKEIFHEPLYRGKQQLYGILKLGSNRNYVFPFVFDVYSSEKMVLYFDTNKNGDLTDDGRLINKGTGRFASYIKIPWNKLINNCPYKGNFLIWFYINSAGWKKGRLFSHYSRTQLA